MTVTTARKVTLKRPSTVEEILCSSRGNGAFITMMKCAVGLAICTDGIEVTLLSYLVPCVAAEWDLSSIQQGSLTASVFAGELVGAMVLGVISDVYGRRPSFQLATGLVAVFGLLTVFAPSYWWLLCFRSMVGVGAGGMEVPFDLLGEIVPHKEKSRVLVDVQATWALGSLFVGFLAWAVLGFGYSWRWLALFSAVPPCSVACCFLFIQESPRWLLANGREREAKEVLRRMAKQNGVTLSGISIAPEEQPRGSKGGVFNLWRVAELRKRTLVSSVVWAAFGFLYYGVILLSTKVMGDDGTCTFDYSILLFASSSELVANLVTRTYVGRLDRSVSLTINFFVSAVMTGIMPLHGALGWLLFTSFVARGAAYVAACFSWVITPDLYPTETRSTGHAVSNSFARCGAIGASYWVASGVSNEGLALLILVVGVVGGITGQALPRDHQMDPTGRNQAVNDEEESRPLLRSGGGREEAQTYGRR